MPEAAPASEPVTTRWGLPLNFYLVTLENFTITTDTAYENNFYYYYYG